MMVQKRTDRVQIDDFAQRSIEVFAQVGNNLQQLVEKAASVNYHGRNARAFKTACVDHAVAFAESTSTTMTKMSDAIEANTSFIATALGGAKIEVPPPGVRIQRPTISADESVEQADDTALNQLRQDVESIFSAVIASFEENLSNFNKLGIDGWQGPEYDETLSALTRLTGDAVDGCNQSRTAMMRDIQTQIDILF